MTQENQENSGRNHLKHSGENLREDDQGKWELVSALADGQLRGAEFARVVGMVNETDKARVAWHAYHVVGDVLRSGELGACADDAAFVARFQKRLQDESIGLALAAENPHNATEIVANSVYGTGAIGINNFQIESANESRFRWKLLAGVASVVAVGVMGWSLVGGLATSQETRAGAPSPAPQMAQTSPPPQVMIRDPHLDALLAAHKQFGGTSALQMPAGFLRNATFEGPSR